MRISTTTIESYRLWRDPEQEWMSEDDLVASIRGEFVPNHKILVGQAYGRILESPDRYRVRGGYDVEFPEETIALGDDVMDPGLALIDRPRTVFEAKAIGRYGAHDVVAKADQMVGAHLIETKATFSSFDFEKYAASCQWRFMADLFQVRRVTYRVACLTEGTNGVIALRDLESFDLYTYDELHQDCARLVHEFATYVTAKGLARLLDQRQQDAA